MSNNTRFRVTSSNGQSYTETTWPTLAEALERAAALSRYGFAVRVQDWRGGPILFAHGSRPLAVFRGESS